MPVTAAAALGAWNAVPTVQSSCQTPLRWLSTWSTSTARGRPVCFAECGRVRGSACYAASRSLCS